MRAAALLCARGALVAGPVVLAFFSGGFFDGPRDVALLVAATVLVLLAASGVALLPRHPAARAALAAALAYAGWIALSATWAPVRDFAGDDAERALLYAAVLVAAAAAFSTRGSVRALEPLAAAGTVIVVAYGLGGRLLPGLVTEHPQISAAGRLDQPLTYWNATGALAAIGLVLCARVAGDRTRPATLRAGAAASAVALGMGCYLSFSRGALAALAAGLLALVLLAPTRAQLRGALLVLAAGGAGAIAAAASPAVRALHGSPGAASARARSCSQSRSSSPASRRSPPASGAPTRPRAAPLVALGGARRDRRAARRPDRRRRRAPAGAAGDRRDERALRLAGLQPLRLLARRARHRRATTRSIGAGAERIPRPPGCSERKVDEVVRDAHSLELETFAELGLVGVALLAALLGAIALGARAVHRADPILAAGPIAALAVWTFHSAIDWDWEMPALTLVAVVLAGALLARAGEPRPQLGEQAALGAQDAARRRRPGRAAASTMAWASVRSPPHSARRSASAAAVPATMRQRRAADQRAQAHAGQQRAHVARPPREREAPRRRSARRRSRRTPTSASPGTASARKAAAATDRLDRRRARVAVRAVEGEPVEAELVSSARDRQALQQHHGRVPGRRPARRRRGRARRAARRRRRARAEQRRAVGLHEQLLERALLALDRAHRGVDRRGHDLVGAVDVARQRRGQRDEADRGQPAVSRRRRRPGPGRRPSPPPARRRRHALKVR